MGTTPRRRPGATTRKAPPRGTAPARGEIWWADLDPTRGREQRGRRPVLIVSVDIFNAGPAELVIALPLTRTARGIRSHARVDPPEVGVRETSFAMAEMIKSISTERLAGRLGSVKPSTMAVVERTLALLLGMRVT